MTLKHYANDPTTSPSILEYIAKKFTMNTVATVATNKNTPITTLCRLANHTNPAIRAAVAENPKTPQEILAQLCQDKDPNVRLAMAESHYIDQSMLMGLANDENPYVACRAKKTLEQLGERVAS